MLRSIPDTNTYIRNLKIIHSCIHILFSVGQGLQIRKILMWTYSIFFVCCNIDPLVLFLKEFSKNLYLILINHFFEGWRHNMVPQHCKSSFFNSRNIWNYSQSLFGWNQFYGMKTVMKLSQNSFPWEMVKFDLFGIMWFIWNNVIYLE